MARRTILIFYNLAVHLLLGNTVASQVLPKPSATHEQPLKFTGSAPDAKPTLQANDDKTENPSLSLALKICFGVFGALFVVSFLFFAVRAARRPRSGSIKPPENEEERLAGFLPPRYSGEIGREGHDVAASPDRASGSQARRASASGGVRVLGRGNSPDERVVSWIQDVEPPPPPPPYEGAREGP